MIKRRQPNSTSTTTTNYSSPVDDSTLRMSMMEAHYDDRSVGSVYYEDDDFSDGEGDTPSTMMAMMSRKGHPPHHFWGRRRRNNSEDYQAPLHTHLTSSTSWTGANPQSASEDEDDFPRSFSVKAKKRKSPFSFAVTFFCFIGIVLYTSARSALIGAVSQANKLAEFSAQMRQRLIVSERNIHKLERKLAAIDSIERQKEDMEAEKMVINQASIFANPKIMEEMNVIQQKLRTSARKAEELREQIQFLSKRDVTTKYGAGVKRVQMELVFPGEENGPGGPNTFVMEMAPVELMPHSVYTFLEMVNSGLLNGCSFIMNALHVLKAAPLPYDGTSASDKARDFLNSGLESVAFREYSPEYPHKRFTVGFAADGSPSFYINTEDNTEIHGGDPCFAKIVSGFDTIKRLESSPTRNGIWFEHRIGIKEAIVL